MAGTLLIKGTPDRTPAYMTASAAADEAPAADTADADAASAEAPPAADPAPAAAGVDLAAGEKVFGKCKACHSADDSKQDKTGPHLWGMVDRPVGSVEGFNYSDAMANHGGTWTAEALDAYLADPKGNIAGTKMSYAGLKKLEDRMNLIAWLAGQSDTPIAPDALGFAAAGAAVAANTADEGADAGTALPEEDNAAEDIEIAQIPYTDPEAPGDDEIAVIAERLAALEGDIANMDYQRARYNPIHFPPMIDEASDQECLACHQEIGTRQVRAQSPAGIEADASLAWYQTLDTYVPQEGTGQSDFHWRHLQSPLAQKTMNLQCNFCHRGNDPREESPDIIALHTTGAADASNPEFTLRKMVNPTDTCLRCHGQMPDPETIMGLGGPWPDVRADMEDQSSDDPTLANGCLSCHQELFRTNRHNVTYLKAAGIEDLAQAGSDTCYGCHGGRAWYRISYPYPRHPWPDMDPEIPEWARDRPTESDAKYARPAN
ncbi:MAG: c-type cytochrome [Paracoccus sp. (in: a-proteobacteria)]